ncbi:MAG: NRDE family protein [Rhodospirillales bacterium]
MCTLVILHRPGHDWPVVIGATRDEMQDRPWKPPARHWPDRSQVTAGIDELAGGTWLGLNDDGVVAGILNRQGSLGPAPDKRSRGELPLEALDHARAEDAAEALAHLEPASYRSFNMVIADAERAFWLKSAAPGNGGGNGGEIPGGVTVQTIPPGVSMLTSYDLNDMRGARTRHHLPRFRAAPAPDPETGDWQAWQALFASRVRDTDAGPEGAMCIVTEYGYGTVSSALIALPRFDRIGMKPVWLFAAGRPGETPYEPVTL